MCGMRRIKGWVGPIASLDDLETRIKSLAPARIRTPDRPSRSPVYLLSFSSLCGQNVEFVGIKPVVHIVTNGL